MPVWLGNRWGEASSAGDKFIGYVHCLDSIVVAVADVSSEVAGNRACAFVVSMLRADPDLLDRIQESRRSIESSCSREANLSESEFFYASSGEMYLVKADIEGKDSSKKVTVESSKTKNANGQGETKALMPNSNSQLEENSSKAAEVATMDSVIEAMVNNVLN